MEKVKELVNDIKSNLSQASSSQRDELRVMRSMLNDREYEVGVYSKEGQIGTVNPALEARDMIGSVLSSTAKISSEEAAKLADEHEFSKSEAGNMINISKEFVNTYLETGRKLPFGGRVDSDISIISKPVEAGPKFYPKKVGVDENGEPKYERSASVDKPAYNSARVIAPCPSWLK